MSRLRQLARLRPASALVLGFSVVVTGLFLFVCAVLLLDARSDAIHAAEQGAENVAATAAQDIARNIELYDLSLQAVVHGLSLAGISTLDPELRQMILFDRSANAKHLGFINVLNEAGEVTADSRSVSPRSGNYATRDYFQALRNNPQDQLFIGRPFLTGPGQPATIPLSRRLAHPDGSFDGVVVGSMRLAYIRELFDRVTLGPSGTIALLRNDGMVLMRLPFSQDDIGRTLAPDSPFFRFATSGETRVIGHEPGDPVDRRYTFRRVGDLSLVVAVGLAQQDIEAPWRAKAGRILSAVLTLCLINLGLVLLLRRASNRGLKAEAAVRQASAESARFLAAMSHDLRTPLSSVLGYADLLSTEGPLTAQQSGRLAALTSAAEHMRHVIKRVLITTTPDTTADQPRYAEADLDALIRDCRAMIAPDAAAKGLSLACWVETDTPRRAMIDVSQVSRVILNLLSNAVKYTDGGSVRLRLSGDRRGLRIEVSDTGPGVPARRRVRLFRAYDRLGAEGGAAEGFGLGLSSAARLVSGMRGRIGYDENPGGGSLFWVQIPTEDLPRVAPVSASVDRGTGVPRHILVADDIATCRDVTGSMLRAAGHTTTEACNGAEAVEQAEAGDFDLVLMDMRMPSMGGLEAARRIRALRGSRSQVPIVACTADITPPQQEEWHDAGIVGCLEKPFDRAALLAVVAGLGRGMRPDQTYPEPPEVAPIAEPILPLLDLGLFQQLVACMSPAKLSTQLDDLAGRLTDLLRRLGVPGPGNNVGGNNVGGDDVALAGLLHDMKGVGGVLGFASLVGAIRRYGAPGTDAERSDRRAELVRVAERSIEVLRHQQVQLNEAALSR